MSLNLQKVNESEVTNSKIEIGIKNKETSGFKRLSAINVNRYVNKTDADEEDFYTIRPRGLPRDLVEKHGANLYQRKITIKYQHGEDGDDGRLPPFATFRTASDNDNLHLLPATTEKMAKGYLVDIDNETKRLQNAQIIENATEKALELKKKITKPKKSVEPKPEVKVEIIEPSKPPPPEPKVSSLKPPTPEPKVSIKPESSKSEESPSPRKLKSIKPGKGDESSSSDSSSSSSSEDEDPYKMMRAMMMMMGGGGGMMPFGYGYPSPGYGGYPSPGYPSPYYGGGGGMPYYGPTHPGAPFQQNVQEPCRPPAPVKKKKKKFCKPINIAKNDQGLNFDFLPHDNCCTEVTLTIEPDDPDPFECAIDNGITPFVCCYMPPSLTLDPNSSLGAGTLPQNNGNNNNNGSNSYYSSESEVQNVNPRKSQAQSQASENL